MNRENKININDLIRNKVGYKPTRNDFSEICKTANNLINKNNYGIKDGIDILTILYGEPISFIKTEDGSNKPFYIFGKDIVDPNAIKQMETALTLPNVYGGAIMPDGHLGYALPIGGVVAMKGVISPHFIGFDISCMMKMSVLDIDPKEFLERKEELSVILNEVTSFGIGANFADGKREHPVMDDPRWNNITSLRKLKAKAQSQLGSSGGGNHFADLMIGEYMDNKKFVCILTHSGSRGTGHKIATYYSKLAKDYTDVHATGIPNGYEWLPLSSEAGQEYWEVMGVMGDYASANHELIHKHFASRSKIDILKSIENKHNFAWKEDHFGENLIVHRKGATPASKGKMGLIPASMATPSKLVIGLGLDESFESSSHGAGRYTSRTKAKENFNEVEHNEVVKNKDIITIGVNADESYQAYKNIDDVMSKQEDKLVKTVANLYPKVVIMGGNRKSDDGD